MAWNMLRSENKEAIDVILQHAPFKQTATKKTHLPKSHDICLKRKTQYSENKPSIWQFSYGTLVHLARKGVAHSLVHVHDLASHAGVGI